MPFYFPNVVNTMPEQFWQHETSVGRFLAHELDAKLLNDNCW